MTFRQLSKITLTLSSLLVIASIVVFIYPGPKFSIEFTGGTLMEIQPPADKTREDIVQALRTYEQASKQSFGNFTVTAIRTASQNSFAMRLPTMTNEQHVALIADMGKSLGTIKELQYNTIGPSLSASLKKKSFQAITISSIAVIIYLALAFRKLPRKLKPWKFGLLAVVGFLHDIAITIGVFTVVGMFTSFEFDTLFVTALLSILAYSVNDTIVIFDRVRSNLTFENRSEDLSTVVSTALHQCAMRTFGTTMATLIMLTALFFLGAESIRWFILALIFGIGIGAYSSYFIAAPLLVFWK